MKDEQDPAAESIDEAIAFCLAQQDEGTHITPAYLLETFPEFHSDLVDFFEDEYAVVGRHRYAKTSLTNKTISRFELQSQIGKGSFGEVWRAWDTSLRREVAIKLPRYQDGDEKNASRFLREARAASRLNHPNIVRVLEVGTAEDTPFICTELVNGIALYEWSTKLRSDSPTSAAMEIAKVTSQVAAGMAHAHEMGIVHRDLNPRNIMVDGNGIPKVLDFGVAKSQSDASTVTIHGEVLGTPAYVSPEQASGSLSDLDGRSDIFSIGIVLYEMLTGKRPFRGDLKLLLHQIRFAVPDDPRSLDPNIPDDLALVCLKCLEKEPADRYQTATVLHEDLEKVVLGQRVHVSLRKSASASASGRTWLVALSSVALLLISILAIRAFAPPSQTATVSDAPTGADGDSTPVEQPNIAVDPVAEPTEKEIALRENISKRKRTYHVDQIEDLVERVIKAFDQHLVENGRTDKPENRKFFGKLSGFEQETNRLKHKFSTDDDWQASVMNLEKRLQELILLKEAIDIGKDAEAYWFQLVGNVRGLVRSIN